MTHLRTLRAALVLGLVATGFASTAAAQGARESMSLKATQKAIRERLMTEAGTGDLIYARVDFNDCALTVQTRTPKRSDGAETRRTYTVHAASLAADVEASQSGPAWQVAPKVADGAEAVRIVTQAIAGGKLVESITATDHMIFPFAREATAKSFAAAFQRLATICQAADVR